MDYYMKTIDVFVQSISDLKPPGYGDEAKAIVNRLRGEAKILLQWNETLTAASKKHKKKI